MSDLTDLDESLQEYQNIAKIEARKQNRRYKIWRFRNWCEMALDSFLSSTIVYYIAISWYYICFIYLVYSAGHHIKVCTY